MRGRILAAALTVALLLTGCQPGKAPVEESPAPTPVQTPEPEKRPFTLPCTAGGSFHPITGTSRLDLTLAPLLYEGLFALDRQFQPQKVLCGNYSVSEDGLRWSFQLRETTFSDGSPLTSAEAAASLKLAMQSPRYAARLADVSKVQAGAGEVTVTLRRPNGALPALLDVPIVKETGDPARPLGTGPYVLSGQERQELTLVARQGRSVPVSMIPLRPVGTGEDLVYAFDAREVALVDTDLLGTAVPNYSARTETTDYPTTTLLYVGFNTRSGPCREESVRRAAAQIMDRQNVADAVLAGHAAASTLPIHPAVPGCDWESGMGLSGLGGGPAAGLETLVQAGWKPREDGRLYQGYNTLNLKLIVNLENTWKAAAADALAANLTSVGIGVYVEKLPWEGFLNALKKGDFDLYLGETAMTADFDVEPLVAPGGALNYGGWNDGALPPLLTGLRAASGAERPAAAQALYARLGQTAPITPICFKNGALLTQWNQVSGAEPTQSNVFFHLEGWRISE